MIFIFWTEFYHFSAQNLNINFKIIKSFWWIIVYRSNQRLWWNHSQKPWLLFLDAFDAEARHLRESGGCVCVLWEALSTARISNTRPSLKTKKGIMLFGPPRPLPCRSTNNFANLILNCMKINYLLQSDTK